MADKWKDRLNLQVFTKFDTMTIASDAATVGGDSSGVFPKVIFDDGQANSVREPEIGLI